MGTLGDLFTNVVLGRRVTPTAPPRQTPITTRSYDRSVNAQRDEDIATQAEAADAQRNDRPTQIAGALSLVNPLVGAMVTDVAAPFKRAIDPRVAGAVTDFIDRHRHDRVIDPDAIARTVQSIVHAPHAPAAQSFLHKNFLQQTQEVADATPGALRTTGEVAGAVLSGAPRAFTYGAMEDSQSDVGRRAVAEAHGDTEGARAANLDIAGQALWHGTNLTLPGDIAGVAAWARGALKARQTAEAARAAEAANAVKAAREEAAHAQRTTHAENSDRRAEEIHQQRLTEARARQQERTARAADTGTTATPARNSKAAPARVTRSPDSGAHGSAAPSPAAREDENFPDFGTPLQEPGVSVRSRYARIRAGRDQAKDILNDPAAAAHHGMARTALTAADQRLADLEARFNFTPPTAQNQTFDMDRIMAGLTPRTPEEQAAVEARLAADRARLEAHFEGPAGPAAIPHPDAPRAPIAPQTSLVGATRSETSALRRTQAADTQGQEYLRPLVTEKDRLDWATGSDGKGIPFVHQPPDHQSAADVYSFPTSRGQIDVEFNPDDPGHVQGPADVSFTDRGRLDKRSAANSAAQDRRARRLRKNGDSPSAAYAPAGVYSPDEWRALFERVTAAISADAKTNKRSHYIISGATPALQREYRIAAQNATLPDGYALRFAGPNGDHIVIERIAEGAGAEHFPFPRVTAEDNHDLATAVAKRPLKGPNGPLRPGAGVSSDDIGRHPPAKILRFRGPDGSGINAPQPTEADFADMASEISYARRATKDNTETLSQAVRKFGASGDRGDIAGFQGQGGARLTNNGRGLPHNRGGKKRGMDVDRLARAMQDEGFFHSGEDMTPDRLIEALRADTKAKPHVRLREAGDQDAIAQAHDALNYYESRGVDTSLKGDALRQSLRDSFAPKPPLDHFGKPIRKAPGNDAGPPHPMRAFRDVSKKDYNGDQEAVRRLNYLTDRDRYIEVELPISRLIATQNKVNPDFVEAASRWSPEGHGLPAVAKYKGKYYVMDGHHRLAARAHAGNSNARVRLYDIDGNTQRDFPLLDYINTPKPKWTPADDELLRRLQSSGFKSPDELVPLPRGGINPFTGKRGVPRKAPDGHGPARFLSPARIQSFKPGEASGERLAGAIGKLLRDSPESGPAGVKLGVTRDGHIHIAPADSGLGHSAMAEASGEHIHWHPGHDITERGQIGPAVREALAQSKGALKGTEQTTGTALEQAANKPGSKLDGRRFNVPPLRTPNRVTKSAMEHAAANPGSTPAQALRAAAEKLGLNYNEAEVQNAKSYLARLMVARGLRERGLKVGRQLVHDYSTVPALARKGLNIVDAARALKIDRHSLASYLDKNPAIKALFRTQNYAGKAARNEDILALRKQFGHVAPDHHDAGVVIEGSAPWLVEHWNAGSLIKDPESGAYRLQKPGEHLPSLRDTHGPLEGGRSVISGVELRARQAAKAKPEATPAPPTNANPAISDAARARFSIAAKKNNALVGASVGGASAAATALTQPKANAEEAPHPPEGAEQIASGAGSIWLIREPISDATSLDGLTNVQALGREGKRNLLMGELPDGSHIILQKYGPSYFRIGRAWMYPAATSRYQHPLRNRTPHARGAGGALSPVGPALAFAMGAITHGATKGMRLPTRLAVQGAAGALAGAAGEVQAGGNWRMGALLGALTGIAGDHLTEAAMSGGRSLAARAEGLAEQFATSQEFRTLRNEFSRTLSTSEVRVRHLDPAGSRWSHADGSRPAPEIAAHEAPQGFGRDMPAQADGNPNRMAKSDREAFLTAPAHVQAQWMAKDPEFLARMEDRYRSETTFDRAHPARPQLSEARRQSAAVRQRSLQSSGPTRIQPKTPARVDRLRAATEAAEAYPIFGEKKSPPAQRQATPPVETRASNALTSLLKGTDQGALRNMADELNDRAVAANNLDQIVRAPHRGAATGPQSPGTLNQQRQAIAEGLAKSGLTMAQIVAFLKRHGVTAIVGALSLGALNTPSDRAAPPRGRPTP